MQVNTFVRLAFNFSSSFYSVREYFFQILTQFLFAKSLQSFSFSFTKITPEQSAECEYRIDAIGGHGCPKSMHLKGVTM